MKKVKLGDILYATYLIITILLFVGTCVLIDTERITAAMVHLSAILFLLCLLPILFPRQHNKDNNI